MSDCVNFMVGSMTEAGFDCDQLPSGPIDRGHGSVRASWAASIFAVVILQLLLLDTEAYVPGPLMQVQFRPSTLVYQVYKSRSNSIYVQVRTLYFK